MRRGIRYGLLAALCAINIAAITGLVAMLRSTATPAPTLVEALTEDRKHAGRKFDDSVVALAQDERETMFAVGIEAGVVDLWTNAPQARKRTIKAHDARANQLAFSADGRFLFTGSTFEDSTKIWNVETGELRSVIADAHGPVGRTPNPNVVVVANTSSFRLYDLKADALWPETYEADGVIQSIAFNNRAGLIALGSASGTIEVWQYSERKGKPVLTRRAAASPYGMGNWVVGLHFSPSGDRLMAVARRGNVDEWDSGTLTKRRTISTSLGWIGAGAFLDRPKYVLGNETAVALVGTKHPSGLSQGLLEIIPPGGETAAPATPLHTNLPVVAASRTREGFVVIHSRATGVFPVRP